MEKKCYVSISRFAEKRIQRLPRYLQEALMIWVKTVETLGILQVRKVPGYHDEPLKGARKGQRSIRLSRAYRAIYTEEETATIEVKILEVSKHEY